MPLFPRSIDEWYKPFAREERAWFIIAIVVSLILAVTTLGWTLAGAKPEVPKEGFEVDPEEFMSMALEFAKRYEGKVVPEGEEVYIAGIRFTWIPGEIRLRVGAEYKFVISSADVLHGFEIIGGDGAVINLMVMPGMAYIAYVKFEKSGVYEIRCNEYCGVGHQNMIGKIIVVE
jgi:cytochrome c oxidase subunit 2